MIAKTIEAVLKENDIICHVYDLETANMTTVIDDMISADGNFIWFANVIKRCLTTNLSSDERHFTALSWN